MKLYKFNFKKNPVAVVVYLKEAHAFLWTRIYGIQIGPWFVGAIRGSRDVPASEFNVCWDCDAPVIDGDYNLCQNCENVIHAIECECHSGSVCGEACEAGRHHGGCLKDKAA